MDAGSPRRLRAAAAAPQYLNHSESQCLNHSELAGPSYFLDMGTSNIPSRRQYLNHSELASPRLRAGTQLSRYKRGAVARFLTRMTGR